MRSSGFFECLKAFIKWHGARKAQKEKFRIILSDSKSLALAEEISGLRGALKCHVDDYHFGRAPPKPKVTKEETQTLGSDFAEFPISKEAMEEFLMR